MTTPTPWSAKPKPVKPSKPAAPQEGNPNTQKTRTWGTKKRRSPRHSNTVRRVLLLASMAWEGRSASEIADTLGVATQYVYQLCSEYRIKLIPKTRSQYAFRVVLEIATIVRLEQIAAQRSDDMTNLVARMIDTLSQEKTLLENLLEPEDEPPPRRRGRPRNKAEAAVDDDPEAED